MRLRTALISTTAVLAISAMALASPADEQAAYAIARDQQILQGDPNNKKALADIVDQLDGAGRWKEAVSYLATLNAAEPNDTARTHQLGMYYSWSENGGAKALSLLKRASEMQPNNSQWAYDY